MKVERIVELLRPFLVQGASLREDQLDNISMYIDMLLKWNARINLTAVREPEEIVRRHFGESLFAAQNIFPTSGKKDELSRVLDIGSGAGFPGLPIKIWWPQVRVTLIESNQKKATFLREVARALTLMEVDVVTTRAENYTEFGDVVTLRAVERFEMAVPIAAKHVAPQGCLVLLIGESQSAKAHELAPSLLWEEPISVPESLNRILLVGKVSRLQ
jgi:16S rRNA (guanine527-N7)-methyltransferase